MTADWLRPMSSAIIWKLASAKPCLAASFIADSTMRWRVLPPLAVSGRWVMRKFYLISAPAARGGGRRAQAGQGPRARDKKAGIEYNVIHGNNKVMRG